MTTYCLGNDQRASVQIPSSETEKIEEYKEMVWNWHPFLTDVWCNMDGLKIMLQLIMVGHTIIMFLLCYVSARTEPSLLPILTSQALFMTVRLRSMGIYVTKLETVYQRDGGQYTVDSAFGNVNREFLIKLSQELINIRSYCARSTARDATLMHQSAEWGMRAFQSSMPHIKDRMKFEECGERKVTLTVMILLYKL